MPARAAVVAFAFVAAAVAPPAAAQNELRLAATTSVDNSGLLDVIRPAFEQECRCRLRVIVSGTGKALKLGESGDVDLLLVHAPDDEKQYIKDGHGVGRQLVMYNAFVLAGPPSDPAAIAKTKTIAGAMRVIANKRAVFVSRGDDSGTHKKEMQLWAQNKTSANKLAQKWRVSAGAGMARALLMADELRGYILTDTATFAALRGKVELRILAADKPPLKNEYSIIRVNPARHAQTRGKLARKFASWIVSPRAQRIIGEYRRFGERLFSPVH